MENQQILIRGCKKSDLNQIKEIFKEFVKYHVSVDSSFIKVDDHGEFFEKFISDNLLIEDSKVFVACQNKKVLGYIFGKIESKPTVYPEPIYGYVDNIAVLEKFQKNGIGEKLILELLKWFKSKNVYRIETKVAVKNPKSMSFWRKMGFTPYIEEVYYIITQDN